MKKIIKQIKTTPPTEEQQARILDLYEKGVSARQIVDALHVSKYHVTKTLVDAGKSTAKQTGGQEEPAKDGVFSWNHQDFKFYKGL